MATEQIVRVMLSEIQRPDVYIRKTTDAKRINLFQEMIKGGPEPLPTDKWVYPFPPINLAKLPTPRVIEFKRDGQKVTRTVNYVIIDGVHRFLAMLGVGLPDIPATIVTLTDPAQLLAAQYLTNRDGKLPITREERDAFIRLMINVHKVGQEKVSELVQISQASVSRIAAGKSGLSKEETSEARKKGAAKRGKKGSAGETATYKPADFFKRVRDLIDEAKEHRAALTAAMKEKDAYWNYCETLGKWFVVIRQQAAK